MIFDKLIDIKELINEIKTYKNNKEYKK